MSTIAKYKVAAILVAALLVLTFLPLSPPVSPVQAAVTEVTITSPTTDDPAYAKTGGVVTVTYNVTCNNTEQGDIKVEILQAGTSTVVASTDINAVSLSSGGNERSDEVTLTGVPSGTYDVRVRARQPTGAGDWNSTTKSNALVVDNTAPVVTLINPNGGNYVHSGEDYTVQWNATDAVPPGNLTVSAKYSLDGGATYTNTAFGSVTKAKGVNSHNWPAANIPDIDCSTARLQLTVTDAAGNSTTVTSASNFYILNSPPSVTITIPNASTVWNGGSTQTITFTTVSAFNLNVDYKLEFYNGSTWITITPGDGWVKNVPVGLTSYSWTVNNAYRGSSAQIRVTVRDKAGREDSSTSPPFTIRDVTAPTVQVTKPAVGDKVYNGVPTQIKWTANDNVAGQNLKYCWYLSTDGGSTWENLCGTPSPGAQGTITQDWTPSVTATKTNCKIKVTATDLATPYANTGEGVSGTFSIIYAATPPTVQVTSPNTAVSWEVGTCQTISWTASDPSDPTAKLTYKIELSTDGGGNYSTTIAVLPDKPQGSYSFTWAVNGTPSTQCRIKVTATNPGSGQSGYDASDVDFRIDAATCAVETASQALPAGWSLISLPVIPVCTNIESVLGPILDKVKAVWYYTGGASGTWKSYAPGLTSPTLTTMEAGKAYWINLDTGGGTLTFQGRKWACPGATPPTYSYVAGWNLVGYKSKVTKTVSTYLPQNQAQHSQPISGYFGGASFTLMDTESWQPWRGCWVFFTGTGPWTAAIADD